VKYIAEHKDGLIGTLVTHGVLLFLLMYFGILMTNPAPLEEGILVNFGDSETGFGMEEPAPGEREPSVKPIESASEKFVAPPPPQRKAAPAEADDAIVTQEVEKTVAVKSQKDKKVTEKVDPEKQRIAEAERLKKEELLRQQKEEQRLLAQTAAEQRKIGEINSRAKNVFGGGGKGSPDSKSTSQGVTYGSGNQGVPQGSANVDRYGPGGGIGNGISASLDGRTSLSLPKPQYPGNEEGVVVVKVTVDKKGVVKKAEDGQGSNTINPDLISAAKKAALQARFNVDDKAPEFQIGSITYRFVLD
jgi:outer membrane biosynthesis protein TonB